MDPNAPLPASIMVAKAKQDEDTINQLRLEVKRLTNQSPSGLAATTINNNIQVAGPDAAKGPNKVAEQTVSTATWFEAFSVFF